ncbi:MAG: PD-(D/E)XK motif protein [Acidobacteriaceae bacterium]
MIAPDLVARFAVLPKGAGSEEFKAISLSENRRDFLAKAEDGAPVFLLHDSSTAKYVPEINFRHLSAQFHVTCRVMVETQAMEGQFCLVSCDGATPELFELFIRCVAAAVEGIPSNAGTRELEACIVQLRDLFHALAAPSSRELVGLWAELYVIFRCGRCADALRMWHSDQFDRFDFSSNALCLEVKATVRTTRAHEFALEQLEPPAEGVGLVASLLLQPLTGGLGVLDLARRIEDTALSEAKLRLKLWQNVAAALGADFSAGLDRQFDTSFAERNLAVYSMADIPRPERPTDSRVTGLRFIVELATVPSSLQRTPLQELTRAFEISH